MHIQLPYHVKHPNRGHIFKTYKSNVLARKMLVVQFKFVNILAFSMGFQCLVMLDSLVTGTSLVLIIVSNKVCTSSMGSFSEVVMQVHTQQKLEAVTDPMIEAYTHYH